LGSGTITIPYNFYENGLYLGTFFIFFGGFLSFYTGYLITYCSEKTNGKSYEEIANTLYGERGLRFTSFCNILCNVGFYISYISLFKSLMPYALTQMGVDLPVSLQEKSVSG
jgi:amino acid permease